MIDVVGEIIEDLAKSIARARSLFIKAAIESEKIAIVLFLIIVFTK